MKLSSHDFRVSQGSLVTTSISPVIRTVSVTEVLADLLDGSVVGTRECKILESKDSCLSAVRVRRIAPAVQ